MIMMTTFIAVRKSEKVATTGLLATPADLIIERSVEERRSSAINDTAGEEKAELLLSLGLTQVNPLEHSPHVRHSFHKLDFLKAYVVGTSNPAVAEHARELLEPDYIVAPNIDLSLPDPEIRRTAPKDLDAP